MSHHSWLVAVRHLLVNIRGGIIIVTSAEQVMSSKQSIASVRTPSGQTATAGAWLNLPATRLFSLLITLCYILCKYDLTLFRIPKQTRAGLNSTLARYLTKYINVNICRWKIYYRYESCWRKKASKKEFLSNTFRCPKMVAFSLCHIKVMLQVFFMFV